MSPESADRHTKECLQVSASQTHLLDQPHHDGSELYADQGPYELGQDVTVRLRVPAGYGESDVWIRALSDAEPVRIPTTRVREDEHERWYEGVVRVHNPVANYRWMVNTPDGYQWVTGRGTFDRDVTDAGDFLLTTHAPPPAWTSDAVVYQVFPDRFARSAAADEREVPDWAEPTAWDTAPEGRAKNTPLQFYGGDLTGVEEHLDHLQALGVNTLYLTPFFPSRSNHRYDGSTFEAVDPLLGGDEALAALSAAVHARGMRLIGDLTTNHTGSSHEWFRTALADETSPEHGFYYWREHAGEKYVSWLGVSSLPKLNFGSQELWARTVDGPDSAIGRWLQPPYSLDGWRIDVANMTGRYADDDYTHEVARRTRATILAANPEGLLVSEHFHDAADDVRGDGWMSNMNYSAFTRPLWAWVAQKGTELDFLGLATTIPRRPAHGMVEAMREFDSRYAWPTKVRLWNMLGSHDTARIRTVTGDPAVVEVAAAMLFGYPGVPAMFMGDEGGFTGWNGEAGRKTMPWDQIAAGGGELWDAATFEAYQGLIAARRASRALRDGGMRWAVVADDAVAFLRETADERVLVVAARDGWAGATLPAHLADGEPELLYGGRIGATAQVTADAAGVHVAGDGPAVGIWRLA
jgi:alpha-glucosidase